MNIIQEIMAIFKVKDFVETEIKEAKQVDQTTQKPGYKTTEFYFSLLTTLGTVVASLSGVIPPALAAQIATGITAIYTIGRSIVKAISDVKSAGTTPAS